MRCLSIGLRSYRPAESRRALWSINQIQRKEYTQMQTPTQIRSAELKNSVSARNARDGGRRTVRPLSRANKPNKLSNRTTSMSTQSPKAAKSSSRYSIGMFSPGEARCDRWQELAHAAQTLVAQSSSGSATKETL